MENEALQEKFDTLANERNSQELRGYLDDQLITDIAELIYEYPEHADLIINNLSISRAAGCLQNIGLPLAGKVIRRPAGR